MQCTESSCFCFQAHQQWHQNMKNWSVFMLLWARLSMRGWRTMKKPQATLTPLSFLVRSFIIFCVTPVCLFPPLCSSPNHIYLSHFCVNSMYSFSRNTDDPEVCLQSQCQLHWPPYLSIHAFAPENGARTPQSPTGQPRSHRNQHRYLHQCEKRQTRRRHQKHSIRSTHRFLFPINIFFILCLKSC